MVHVRNAQTADVDWLEDQNAFSLCRTLRALQAAGGSALGSLIITTEANAFMKPIHARMPVILPPSSYDQWLDLGFADVAVLNSFLRSCPSEDLMAYTVSTLLNNPRSDVCQCLEPLAGSD
jgi:putative SOS response-associated peptidase YedK